MIGEYQEEGIVDAEDHMIKFGQNGCPLLQCEFVNNKSFISALGMLWGALVEKILDKIGWE